MFATFTIGLGQLRKYAETLDPPAGFTFTPGGPGWSTATGTPHAIMRLVGKMADDGCDALYAVQWSPIERFTKEENEPRSPIPPRTT